eukprot:8899542-Ditylum_brightwellii.AAC.1
MVSTNFIFTLWLDIVLENQSLLKYTGVTKETLSTLTTPGVHGIDTLRRLKGIVVLLRVSGRMGHISMIHHIDEIGSPILIWGELKKTVALLGFKDNAVPATVDKNSLLEKSEEDAPKIEFLSKIKDEYEVFKQKNATTQTDKTKICNLILLPLWLAKVLIRNKSGMMDGAFIVALRAAVAKDATKTQVADAAAAGIAKNIKDITILL